jgi:hypothetical protein
MFRNSLGYKNDIDIGKSVSVMSEESCCSRSKPYAYLPHWILLLFFHVLELGPL